MPYTENLTCSICGGKFDGSDILARMGWTPSYLQKNLGIEDKKNPKPFINPDELICGSCEQKRNFKVLVETTFESNIMWLKDNLISINTNDPIKIYQLKVVEEQKIRERENEKRKIEEARIYAETFPDPDLDDVIILHIINPYKEKRKKSKGFLPGNAECIPIYAKIIPEMENEYPPTKFKYHAGNILAPVKWQLKGGYIICTKDIVMDVKKRIEGFKVPEGNFILEPITDKTTIKEMIETLKRESKQMKL